MISERRGGLESQASGSNLGALFVRIGDDLTHTPPKMQRLRVRDSHSHGVAIHRNGQAPKLRLVEPWLAHAGIVPHGVHTISGVFAGRRSLRTLVHIHHHSEVRRAPNICAHGPPPGRGVVLLAGGPEVDAPTGGWLAGGRHQGVVGEVMGPLSHHELPVAPALVPVPPTAGAARDVGRLLIRDHALEGARGPPGSQAAVGGAQVVRRIVRAGSVIVVFPVVVVLAIGIQVDLKLNLDWIRTATLLIIPWQSLHPDDITQEPVEAVRCNHLSAVLSQGLRSRHGGDDTPQSFHPQVVESRQWGCRHVAEDHEIPQMRTVLGNVHHELRPRRGCKLLRIAPCHFRDPCLALQRKEHSLVVPRIRLLGQRVRPPSPAALVVPRRGPHAVVGHLHVHVRVSEVAAGEDRAHTVTNAPPLHHHARTSWARGQIQLGIIQHRKTGRVPVDLVGHSAGDAIDKGGIRFRHGHFRCARSEDPLTPVPCD
mmetsp:Transcript_95107/g.254143  ORF Transcript_95107/g.254143 Transcript_95107/m.254143 type:complete len:482 (+) Transcript_95107:3014-4459(+)